MISHLNGTLGSRQFLNVANERTYFASFLKFERCLIILKQHALRKIVLEFFAFFTIFQMLFHVMRLKRKLTRRYQMDNTC